MIPFTLDNDSKRSWFFFFPFDLFVSRWYKHDLSLREPLILPLPFDTCLSSAFLPLISSFSHIAHLARATTCKQPTSGIDCLSSFENIHPLASCIDTAPFTTPPTYLSPITLDVYLSPAARSTSPPATINKLFTQNLQRNRQCLQRRRQERPENTGPVRRPRTRPPGRRNDPKVLPDQDHAVRSPHI
jgi:hypothetical protein